MRGCPSKTCWLYAIVSRAVYDKPATIRWCDNLNDVIRGMARPQSINPHVLKPACRDMPRIKNPTHKHYTSMLVTVGAVIDSASVFQFA